MFVLVLLIVLQSSARPLQNAPPQPPQDDRDTIRVKVELVVLHATVQNHNRALVSGLVKEDFKIYEDGVLQKISSFSHEDIPVTIGLVVDNSGSMIPKYQEVIVAAVAFARSSHPADQMFVIHFNEKVAFGLPDDQAFTDKEVELLVALSKIKADGMTALYDATAAALEHLKGGKWDKKVLLVISDGADNSSKHKLAQVMAMAVQSEAIIYTIGLFEEGDPDRNPGVLKQLAKTTGGEAYLPDSIKRIVPICEQIARDIRNQYTLTYIPTNTKQDGAYRSIQVTAETPKHGRLSVRTRAGYNAPLKSQPRPTASNQP